MLEWIEGLHAIGIRDEKTAREHINMALKTPEMMIITLGEERGVNLFSKVSDASP